MVVSHSADKFRVSQIDHVEMFVPDRSEAARWYADVLGLAVVPGYEDWASDPMGPLMISSDGGSTKLALFQGESPQAVTMSGFQLVAFRVPGADFIRFLKGLSEIHLLDLKGARVTPAAVVDHDKAYSLYFTDPYDHQLEITSYEYEVTTQLLRDEGLGAG